MYPDCMLCIQRRVFILKKVKYWSNNDVVKRTYLPCSIYDMAVIFDTLISYTLGMVCFDSWIIGLIELVLIMS